MSFAPKNPQTDAKVWQQGVWDEVAKFYVQRLEPRFAPIVRGMLRQARLRAGEHVVDLGCGTGPVTLQAAHAVGPSGRVDAIDISDQMLRVARTRVADAGLTNVTFHNAGAEALPLPQHTADAILAGMSLMFVLDRAAAAREIARVLRPGGRLVATFPAGSETCDLVKFQRIVGSFAPEPPVKGVGPGSMANPAPFLRNLADSGIVAAVEQEEVEFDFKSLQEAFDVLAHVTASRMSPDKRDAASTELLRQMWPRGDGPRRFRNMIQFLVGSRA